MLLPVRFFVAREVLDPGGEDMAMEDMADGEEDMVDMEDIGANP